MSATTHDTDVIRPSAIRAWWPVMVGAIGLAAGGLASYLQLRFELELVTSRLGQIEARGSDHSRQALARVEALESGAAETRQIVTAQGITLERIDRRLGLLLCRTDRRYCDVER